MWLTLIIPNINRNNTSQKAFNISEAGIKYYLWHLSHNNTDYKDGKTTLATPDPNLGYGPYVHNYTDNNAAVTGTYTLWIKPQGVGSTIVTVRSIGKVNGGSITRTIEAQVGAPSFCKLCRSVRLGAMVWQYRGHLMAPSIQTREFVWTVQAMPT